ncbi:MAG: methyltransferase domain-containing protein [Ilumatobacteraceae bacterium]
MTPHDPTVALFDAVTCRHLDALGVGAGWRCWDVGGGGPSIPAWMAGRVGPLGRVLATGIDVDWSTGREAFEVRSHDVVRDETPPETFDLVHARILLARVSDRHVALRNMVRALPPGGLLLVEELDIDFQPCATPDASGPAHYLSNRIRAGLLAELAQRGVDFELGRKLPRLLRQAGLVDVRAEGHLALADPAAAAFEAMYIELCRDALVTMRAASHEELDRHLDAACRGRIDVAAPPLISAWGRLPAG